MRLTLTLPLLAFATAAIGAPDARPMLSAACRTEMQTLCPAGGDRDARRECMMTNRDKISAPCKTELLAMRAAMQKWRAGHPRGPGGDMTPPPSPADGSAPPPQ